MHRERIEIELDVEVGHDRDQLLRKPDHVGVLRERLRRTRRLQRLGIRDEFLNVGVLGQQLHRRLGSYPPRTRHVVRGVSNERQIIGDLRRRNPEFLVRVLLGHPIRRNT